MKVKEQLLALQKALNEWAKNEGGTVVIAQDYAHMWEIAALDQTSQRVILAYEGEEPRGDFGLADVMGRVDRRFAALVTRARGYDVDVSDSLAGQYGTPSGNSRPFYDLVEEAREAIRHTILDDPNDESPPYFRSIERVPYDVDAPMYAYLILFTVGTQLESLEAYVNRPWGPGSPAGEVPLGPGILPPVDESAGKFHPGEPPGFTPLPPQPTPPSGFFTQQIPVGPFGSDGVDPTLGFPYPSVDYALHIITPSTFLDPVGFTWTVPDLNPLTNAYRIYNVTASDVYYAKHGVPAGPVTWRLIPAGGFISENPGSLVNQYVCFRSAPTANPGIQEFQIGPTTPAPNPYNAWLAPPHQLWPGATPAVIVWDGRDANNATQTDLTKCTLKFKGLSPGETIAYFKMFRTDGGSVNQGAFNYLATISPGVTYPNTGSFTDSTTRNNSLSAYFYLLVGYSASGNAFPYNIVYLSNTFALSATVT